MLYSNIYDNILKKLRIIIIRVLRVYYINKFISSSNFSYMFEFSRTCFKKIYNIDDELMNVVLTDENSIKFHGNNVCIII